MTQETIDRIRKFSDDRDWDQFHSPANLAKSIVIEAAELLECFQWSDEGFNMQHVKEELADVLVYSQNLLDKLGLDADEIVNMKMSQNEAKYPVEKSKGSAAKYDQLQSGDDVTKKTKKCNDTKKAYRFLKMLFNKDLSQKNKCS